MFRAFLKWLNIDFKQDEKLPASNTGFTDKYDLLVARVNRNIENGDFDKAFNRLLSFIGAYPNFFEAQFYLATLYQQSGNEVKAGKYFFFIEELNESQKECITAFEKSYGNDEIIILKKLLPKQHFKVKKLSHFQKRILYARIKRIELKHGFVPVFCKGIYAHLQKCGSEITGC